MSGDLRGRTAPSHGHLGQSAHSVGSGVSRLPRAGLGRSAEIWQRRYLSVLVGVDLVMILASTLVAFVVRFGDTDSSVRGISYVALSF
ncbi:MAG TPA: hypothetical protein VHC43_01315, partial [Mycobacteriales bacterium]|nr:hypothetical protein [Mycobacteriales bacterium]